MHHGGSQRSLVRTGRWGASTARSESVEESTRYTSAKVSTTSMPQPPAAVVGAKSWLAAPPAAAYGTGLYCRPSARQPLVGDSIS